MPKDVITFYHIWLVYTQRAVGHTQIIGDNMYTEIEAALSNNDNGGAHTGNWRSHLLIDCAQCHKPMGSHNTNEAICNECTTNNLKEGG